MSQIDTGASAGWSLSYYYGNINGATLDANGTLGLRTLDGNGNAAGAYYTAGSRRTMPQVRGAAQSVRPTARFEYRGAPSRSTRS